MWATLIWPLWTNFSEILIEINTSSFKKMHLKMSAGKWRLFGLGLNELNAFLTNVHNEYNISYTTKNMQISFMVATRESFGHFTGSHWPFPFGLWNYICPEGKTRRTIEIKDILSKCFLNSKSVQCRLSRQSITVIKSFWKFARNKAWIFRPISIPALYSRGF